MTTEHLAGLRLRGGAFRCVSARVDCAESSGKWGGVTVKDVHGAKLSGVVEDIAPYSCPAP